MRALLEHVITGFGRRQHRVLASRGVFAEIGYALFEARASLLNECDGVLAQPKRWGHIRP
jgi:hypothetical protein